MTIARVAVLLAVLPFAVVLGFALKAAEERGWIRQGKKSASTVFAVMDDIFSPSASQARQVLQEQKRIGQRTPTPGDWLDTGPLVTGRFAGKLTIAVDHEDSLVVSTDRPDYRVEGGDPASHPQVLDPGFGARDPHAGESLSAQDGRDRAVVVTAREAAD